MKMRLFSGHEIDPFDLKPHDINIVDIAHSLAHQCRYGGHSSRFYSVAEHCCLLFDRLRDPWALLHDAAESYLCDVPRPVRRHPAFAFYNDAEDRALRVIARAFGLPRSVPMTVRQADDEIWPDEMNCLFHGRCRDAAGCVAGHGHFGAWEPGRAEEEFLRRWRSFQ